MTLGRAMVAALLVMTVAVAGCTEQPSDDGTPPITPPTPPSPPTTPPNTPPTPPTPPTSPPAGTGAFREHARLAMPGEVAAGERATWTGGGVSLADLDGDRFLDAFLSGPDGLKLYANTSMASGGSDVTAAQGAACGCRALAAMPADMDNDDDADLLVLVDGAASRLYRNDNGRLALMESPGNHPELPSDATAGGWLDLDNDGLLDVIVFRAGGDPVALRNLNGSFEAAPEAVWPAGAGAALTAAFVDVDADSYLDVIVVGAEGLSTFRNLNGSFEAHTSFNNPVTGDVAVAGDVGNDGPQDLLVVGDDGVQLLTNSRGRSFRLATDTGLPSSPVWSAALVDYDLDGYLDVVVASRSGGLALYRNEGDTGPGTYTLVAADETGLPSSGAFRGLALGDVDKDGRPDLVASRLDGDAHVFLNNLSTGHFFKVEPSGIQSNRDGIGARIVASGDRLLLERYVVAGASGLSTSATEVIFGLGDGGVNSLRIQWPSGTFQDQSIPSDNNRDRILLASEEPSRSEWGDNAC